MHHHPRHPAAAFTLVELLVVIAIIALLIGILLPVLGAAKEAAKAGVCRSNIRQIAIANTTYAVDNHEFLVPASFDIANELHRWHGFRAATSDAFDPARGPLRDYLGEDGKVKRCPSFNNYREDSPGVWSLTFEAGCGGYGYNSNYLGGRSDRHFYPDDSRYTAATHEIMQPSGTVLYADAGLWQQSGSDLFLIEYSFLHPPYFLTPDGVQTSWGHPTPSLHFRHGGLTASVAWADGHVSSPRIEWSAPNTYCTMLSPTDLFNLGSGWFGPNDRNDLYDLQ
jgi:prepilin-type processing-associated H-X9-DG protein/prepilin-type N-terminal cleavage/methylation domain-containing protein